MKKRIAILVAAAFSLADPMTGEPVKER